MQESDADVACSAITEDSMSRQKHADGSSRFGNLAEAVANAGSLRA